MAEAARHLVGAAATVEKVGAVEAEQHVGRTFPTSVSPELEPVRFSMPDSVSIPAPPVSCPLVSNSLTVTLPVASE
jgi:hypothetical protein